MLAQGTRVGPYEIVAPLGSGGMGEVYTARDTRLERTVAIKILPAALASDAAFQARFALEARVISALNHPHICALYDVGPGYFVMEHCDGKTLAQRLARGPLSLDQVLEFGSQIADALDKAHRAGIVHRDLKPANIMITKSGVKLLDFGLAKRNNGFSPASTTEEGRISGTVQYMAPELFAGRTADARSDVFAFGAVLYEMAAGKPAFNADSKAKVIAAILAHAPPPIESAASMDRLIRACLEKDPDERIQTAHDVLLELRWIAQPESARRTRARQFHVWAGIAVAALGATGVAMWKAAQPAPMTVRPARFQIQPQPGVSIEVRTFGERAPLELAVSPDGAWVAFCGRDRASDDNAVYLRSTKEIDSRLVMGSAGGGQPFFSPNSRWLAFVAGGFLQKVPVEGGQPSRICPVEIIRGATWGDDGTILFSDAHRLLRVSADGGAPRVVTDPALPERHNWPQFLPGSNHALITVMRGMGDRWRKVAVLSLADGRIRELAPGTHPRYSENRIIYDYTGTLYSLPFDLQRLEAKGEPKPVLDDVYFYSGSGRAAFDLSRNGSLVYVPGARRVRDTEVVWIDRRGTVTPAVTERRPYLFASMSPDGKRIAVTALEAIEDRDIWVFDVERGGSTRITVGLQPTGNFTWSRDGRWLYCNSLVTGLAKLVRIPADGIGPAKQLTFGFNNNDAVPQVSPDETTLIFVRNALPAVSKILMLSLNTNDPPRPFVGSPALEMWPSLSPDGRWVAYESDETGRREIHVRPFPAREPRVTVSVGGGQHPFWSSDGREVFYRKGKELWSAAVSMNPGFHAGVPKRLFAAQWLGSNLDAAFQPSADGKRFLTVRHPPEEQPERRIVYAPDWIRELQ